MTGQLYLSLNFSSYTKLIPIFNLGIFYGFVYEIDEWVLFIKSYNTRIGDTLVYKITSTCISDRTSHDFNDWEQNVCIKMLRESRKGKI